MTIQTESRCDFASFIHPGTVTAETRRDAPDVSTDRDEQGDIDAARRREQFIVTLLPAVLDVNARIRRERSRLLSVIRQFEEGRPLHETDCSWLSRLARRYGTGNREELLRRVDEVPPSLAIAQAAVETGWGNSRCAPVASDPAAAIESYAMDLNANEAYRAFRGRRARQRAAGEPVDGHSLAGTLEQYSAKGWNHVTIMRAVIRDNRLEILDRVWLAPCGSGVAQLASA